MTGKLFIVTTRVADFGGYKDIALDWFIEKRARRLFGPNGTLGIDYDEVIANYDARDHYSEAAVEELFTEREAETFVAWLKAHRPIDDDNTTIREHSLPINSNTMPLGAIPVGGLQDFLAISKASDYDLPFKVWAISTNGSARETKEQTND